MNQNNGKSNSKKKEILEKDQTEILEMKRTINQIKNSAESCTNR